MAGGFKAKTPSCSENRSMVLKCYIWGNLRSTCCWKAWSCSLLFLTSATSGICLTPEWIKGIKLVRSDQEEERLYVGLACVEGPGKAQECCVVGSETTGRGSNSHGIAWNKLPTEAVALLPWRYPKPSWTQPCGMCSEDPAGAGNLGDMTPSGPFKPKPDLGLDSVSWSCSWSPQLLDAAVLSSSSWRARQEHSPVRGSNDWSAIAP